MVLVSASLTLAIKGSALVQLPLLAPWLVVDQLRGARRDGWPVLGTLARLALLAWVGLYRAIDDYLHTGNPTWPMRLHIPSLDVDIPGPVDPHEVTWNGMHGLDSYFFSGDGDFTHMRESWFDASPFYEPNVASGGFGVVFARVILPLLVAGLLVIRAVPRSGRRAFAMAYVLFALGLTGSTPWIPRFILAAAIAAAVALAAIGAVGRELGAAIAALSVMATMYLLVHVATAGLPLWREQGFVAVWELPRHDRAVVPVLGRWPAGLTYVRDIELGPDDALAYDSHTQHVGSLYPWDYGSRVVWIEPDGDFDTYVASLRSAHVRWVDVDASRPMVGALRDRGAVLVGTAGGEMVLDVSEVVGLAEPKRP
jgi:hypothetical protein